jgi:hypothetical protein
MKREYLLSVITLIVLALILSSGAMAAVVGRFVKVEGQVDVLKQGKLPAVPAKPQDPVEPGDVIRTKSQARAQVRFVDDTLMTLAPESRLAVSDYVFEPSSRARRAVLKFFKGLMHLVITRQLQLEEPDFIVQTLTAVIGERGTESYTLQKPNSTLVYLIDGLLGVSSSNLKIPAMLMLGPMQYTEVVRDQAPGPAQRLTPADVRMLRKLMETGVPDSARFQPPGGLTAFPATEPGVGPEEYPMGAPPTLPGPLTPSPSPGAPRGGQR